MEKVCMFVVVFVTVVFTTYSTTYYVKTDGSDGNNGTSWATAFATVQKALDVAQAGDQIWVAKGTYKPTYDYGLGGGSRYYHFRLKNNVALYGGFAGTETSVDQRTNYGVGGVNETILSGDIGTPGDNSDNCYHVFYHPDNEYSLTSHAILDGVTIKDGFANAWTPHDHGAGMFNGNQSHPTIRNCVITNNRADRGAGIYNGGSSSTYINCLIYNNIAGTWGGAMYTNAAATTLINCTIVANNSSSAGGGFYNYSEVYNVKPTLKNCIVWGNNAIHGKQFYNDYNAYANDSYFVLEHCCYRNLPNDIAGALSASNCITSDPIFIDYGNNDFRVLGISPCVDAGNNSFNSESYDIRGAGYPRKLNKTTGSEGTIDIGAYEYNVSDDPLPVELTSLHASVVNGAVVLRWSTAMELHNYGFEVERRWNESPVRETIGFVRGFGTSNAPREYTFTDTQLSRSGRYEYRLKQIDADGGVSYSQGVEIEIAVPKELVLYQNYPNPFNPTTTIEFTIAEDGYTELSVYDVLGREVARLVDGELRADRVHRVVFDGAKFSAGVYYYKLENGKQVRVKNFVMVK
ncbi:MAG: T9SS type A sorting domain-containing protein [Bacteroidetes bacterium]|nr:T9SS type A sorting domain-containing protein [Bacteroidota bacterium]